jgi:hypothetical protein
MPESLKPLQPQQSHAQNLRNGAVRKLSRSPHPYHRQRFEIRDASERLEFPSANKTPPRSKYNTDDESIDRTPLSAGYCESTPSDSGTEADDEHFLKGLPAPKSRPHKGLRALDGVSASPSPLPSPALLETDLKKALGYLPKTSATSTSVSRENAIRKAADKIRNRRKVEIVRRASETGILGFVAGLLCIHPEVRNLIWLWRRGNSSSVPD